jgi:endoglucanase
LVQGTYTFRLTVTDNLGATGSDDVVVTVNGSTPPSSTIHIEAENWTNMSGVQTETVYDAGGGLNVGWIDLGDWMEYTINPSTSGAYTVNLRIATPNNGAQFQIKSANGTVLATVNVPNTGAYQTWQTTSTTINLTAGQQTIRLQSSAQPGWNINWLDLTLKTAAGMTVQSGARPALQLNTASVDLFPNPVQDRFTLTLHNSYSGQVKVQIVSMNGVVQKEFAFTKADGTSQNSLSIGNLPKGRYTVAVLMDGRKETRALIKL